MIHVIGNSHCHYFAENDNIVALECNKTHPYFRSYSIGAAISYNFFQHHLSRVKDLIFNYIKPKSEDYILLAGLTEIDSRWHLPKRVSETGLSIDVVVNECAERYFRAILELKNLGLNMIIFGAHPSTTAGHNDDQSNPVYGDCLNRNKISKCYNNKLKEMCLNNDIIYIDIYDYLIDKETGLTKMEYYRDYCHLNNKSHPYMVEEFKIKGLIK